MLAREIKCTRHGTGAQHEKNSREKQRHDE
jgi:hypothetical protein